MNQKRQSHLSRLILEDDKQGFNILREYREKTNKD